MRNHLLTKLFLAMTLFLFISSCGKSVEGTYSIVKGPYSESILKSITLTLGKDTFVFSTGRSGTYEVSDGKIIFSSPNFSEVMRIEGDDLVNDEYIFRLQQ